MSRASRLVGRVLAALALTLATTSLGTRGVRAQAPEGEAPRTDAEPDPDAEGESSARDATADATAEDRAALEALLQDRVVGAASRSADSARSVPAAVYSIPGTDLETYGIRSVDEALAYLGLGIFVQSSGWDYVSATDLGVHGVLMRDDNRHVLLLVDGHVWNAQDRGIVRFDTTLGVPLSAIDSIEIMLGPGSVAYGANAMLAVVQVNTRSGRETDGFSFVSEGSLDFPTGPDRELERRGDGAALGARNRVGLSYGKLVRVGGHDLDLSAHAEFVSDRSATYRVTPQTGDYLEYTAAEGAWGTTPGRHELRVPSLVARASYRGFRLMAQSTGFRRTTPFSGTWNDPRSRVTEYAGRLELSHEADPTARLHLRTRLYGDVTAYNESNVWIHDWWCAPGQANGCLIEYRTASRSGGLEQLAEVDWKRDGTVRTTFGYDLRVRDTEGRPADYRELDTGALVTTLARPHYRIGSFLGAVFVQQVLELGAHAVVNAGVRLDADSLFGVRASPRVSISYSPRERTTLRFAYAEAFRGPSPDELNYTDLVYVLPPSSLSAEVARFTDLEWTQRFEHGRISVRGFAGLYTDFVDERLASDTEVADAIADGRLSSTAQPGLVIVPANAGRIVTFGGTASATIQPSRRFEVGTNLTLGSSYDATGWELDSLGKQLPRFHGNLRFSYRFSDAAVVSFASAFSSARTGLTLPGNGADVARDVRGVGDLRATFSGRLGDTGGLSYRAGASYAFNARSTNLLSPGPLPDVGGMPDPFGSPSAVAAPLQKFFLFVGLRYAQ